MNDNGGGKLGGRDDVDRALARQLQALTRGGPVSGPATSDGEPGDDEILRYFDGAASASERETLGARIDASPYASARLAVLAAASTEVGERRSAPDPTPRAARYVFHLASQVLTFLRGPTLPSLELTEAPALRSAAPAHAQPAAFYEITHSFGETVARLEIEQVGHALALGVNLTVGGQVVNGARVTLSRDRQPVDSMLTEAGRCTFFPLEPACYQLELRRAGQPIGTLSVDVL